MPLAVTWMHQRGPGPPDATDATKDASLYQGKQVIREADSPLLKGKKTVKPKWRKALGIRMQGEKHPVLRTLRSLLVLLSSCGVCFFGALPVRTIAGWGAEGGVGAVPPAPPSPSPGGGGRLPSGAGEKGLAGGGGGWAAPPRLLPLGARIRAPSGGQQGAPEDRQCRGWAGRLPAPPGQAGTPAPDPEGPSPVSGASGGQRGRRAAGSLCPAAALLPGTLGRLPPTGSPVWSQ